MVLKSVLLVILMGLTTAGLWAQCNQLRPQKDISFNTDQDCAPVTVTQFSITYYFNVPQDPATIQIMYEWNDPANTITLVDQGSGERESRGERERGRPVDK